MPAYYKKPLPDYEVLHEILELRDDFTLWYMPRDIYYFKEDGKSSQIALCNKWNNYYSFKKAFNTINNMGYYSGYIFNTSYLAHRIIWKMVYVDPEYIDHIDGNPLNNRIENLRDCSFRINSSNKKLPSTNTSGSMGIHYRNGMPYKPWVATIKEPFNKVKYIGSYSTKELAIEAWKERALEYGYHENHGR